jgi:mono/diheme cytochrome c family protein
MFSRTIPFLAALLLAVALRAAAADPPATVDFNREIRPILSGTCFKCHGPDDGARKSGLRFDLRDAALKKLKDGKTAIMPGDPAASELVRRITTDDEDDLMPPPKAAPRLTPRQVETFKQWIAQGAKYAVHWAYVRPTRPELPTINEKAWPKNDIDSFILARLEKEPLHPNQEADRYALIRRLSIDLTGLPPTLADADQFANDKSADAYEKLVDRLLASPAFGERWASVWLDLARYADSQGFAPDEDRTIWRYRDWVVQALNDNMPYDQFVTEQLAGDLLPNPTQSQLIATAFNRNTLTQTEGGTNDEEFRIAAIIDRVNTTTQVFLASTFACAQCHNHKYDPITQKEYFQLFAIFNNTLDNDQRDDAPFIETPRVGMEAKFAQLKPVLDRARKTLEDHTKRVDADQPDWEKSKPTLPKEIAPILAKDQGKRTKEEKDKLTQHHRSLDPTWNAINAEVKKLTTEYATVSTTVPVTKEGPARESHILLRGNWEAKGDKVEPGLPSLFHPDEPKKVDRLALANWIVHRDNPLTARVVVNRLWEQFFGTGIVETAEDFGLQGELPSHPELLDYLATEYVRLNWDTKKLIKLIVTSAAYRQSSAVTPEKLAKDPSNRLISRGPRVRLGAEAVRDQSLFAAGLLNTTMFGPPCQPAKPNFGLSAAFGPSTDWKADAGPERFRRALYIRIRRNAPYPSMQTFDAPERTTCTLRRSRTNTPLQALVTLNDPCYIEAAQGLARRVTKQGGDSTASRITFAFRTLLTRPPTSTELQRLTTLFDQAKSAYAKDEKAAGEMASKPLGEASKEMNLSDLAAWTVVSNVILNLDEALAKR